MRHPRYAAIFIFATLLLLTLMLLWQQRQKAIEVERYQLLQQVSHYAAAIESNVRTAMVVSETLRTEVVLEPDQALPEFDERIRLLLKDFPLFRHIALAPDLVVRYVYPAKGNEAALGLDYRKVPEQYKAVQKAVALGKPVLAGPVALVQGGTGLVIRVPVLLDNHHLWGLITAVLPLERLLTQSRLVDLQQNYYVGLSGRDGDSADNTLFWGDALLQGLPAVEADIRLPGGHWRLHAYPKQPFGWLHGLSPWIAMALLSLTALVSYGSFFLLRLSQERQQALQTVAYQASFDPLTGLANRSVLISQLTLMLQQAKDQQRPLAVLSLDLDEFKQINESLGHGIGDQLLQQIAARIQQHFCQHALAARVGGDEFVLVVAQAEQSAAPELVCQQLLKVFSQPFDINKTSLSVTASIGVALYPHDGLLAADLLKHADRAMHAAKQLGRNTFHFYDAAMQKEADRFVSLHHEMLQGIEQHQFFLVYQPIFDIAKQRFSKCEALVRWQHPTRGLVSPADFIPVAERTGAIRPLGQWILQQALLDTQLFNQLGLDVQVSVNRSSQEFNHVKVADEWLALLEQAGIAPEQLIIEITESLFMDRLSVQQANVLTLHQHGVKLAIDDFGTGYSALNYLSRYPVDFIKIDRSFIQQVAEQAKARALVAVLINMAKVLNVAVVAEGVEQASQYLMLEALGCDYIQGYYFSRPLQRADFISLLQQPVRPA